MTPVVVYYRCSIRTLCRCRCRCQSSTAKPGYHQSHCTVVKPLSKRAEGERSERPRRLYYSTLIHSSIAVQLLTRSIASFTSHHSTVFHIWVRNVLTDAAEKGPRLANLPKYSELQTGGSIFKSENDILSGMASDSPGSPKFLDIEVRGDNMASIL